MRAMNARAEELCSAEGDISTVIAALEAVHCTVIYATGPVRIPHGRAVPCQWC
jgi:hypothetical protein